LDPLALLICSPVEIDLPSSECYETRVANRHFQMPNNSNLAFLPAFGSEVFGLAVWHYFFCVCTKIYNLAVTLKCGINLALDWL